MILSFFKVFLLGLFAFNANISTSADHVYDAASFDRDVKQVQGQLISAARRKPFRLKKLNDSLRLVSEASFVLLRENDLERSEELLKEALKTYSGNSYADLFMARLYDSLERYEEANKSYESFLKKSRSFTDYERAFVRSSQHHQIRRYTYFLLSERGVNFSGREHMIQTKIPFVQKMMESGGIDQFFMIFFLAGILGGGIFLLCTKLFGMEIAPHRMQSLIIFYLGIWAGYIFWMAKLALGVPHFIERKFGVLVIVGSFFILSLYPIISKWARRNFQKPAEGFKKCPKCKEVVPNTLLECLNCRHKLR